MTAPYLAEMGIVDQVVDEPFGGAHRDRDAIAATLKAALLRHIAELSDLEEDELLDGRYQKFRQFGEFKEAV